jgi:cholesterol oxidase
MDYDAIIVGSGFGATVAVSKLVEQGRKVLMLERGTWWVTPEQLSKPPAPKPGDPPPLPSWAKQTGHPVQYWPRPDHTDGLLDLFASIRHSGNVDGLYQYSRFDQADILSASGVGGGSLIYSNATLQPEAAVLAHIGLRLGDAEYEKARSWLVTNRGVLNKVVTKIPLPASRDVANLGDEDYLYLDRARVLRDAAATVSQKRGLNPPAPWTPLDLAVAEYHEDGDGNADVNGRHTFCERQGRCILGCLPQARHTLNKTLYKKWISDPAKGVTLWPLSEVRHVRRVEGGYEVVYRDRWNHDGDERTVRAPMVVLAAGTLGTNEILLRSKGMGGLALSDQLGQRFSTNGNFGGFCIDTAHAVNSTRGPVNTSHVDIHLDGRLMVVEDTAIPSMFSAVASTAIRLLDEWVDQRGMRAWAHKEKFKLELLAAWFAHRLPDLRPFLPHLPDTYDPSDARTEAETVANIFFFNCMGQDEPTGRFELDDDDLDLTWDRHPGEQEVFAQIEGLLRDFSDAMGGRYVALPLWRGFGDRKLTITHPLGGCSIGNAASDGVVDEYGRVFDAAKPAGSGEVHPGLLVTDASVMPGAVVAHPTMTIVAQAIKTMDHALAPSP